MSTPHKIKLGVIGCGERGNQLAALFKEHGGYELHAVADYFPDVAQETGKTLGVEPARCFAGLDGYKKLLASGVEAVALETPPCFFPEHAGAAVAANCHVFLASPVAVDAPGCLQIESLAKQKRCVHVDTQITTDPTNIEVAQRIRDGDTPARPFFGPARRSRSLDGSDDERTQESGAGLLGRSGHLGDVALAEIRPGLRCRVHDR